MTQYIFTDARQTNELERLQAIERVFDPASRRRIEATGIASQWQCLEVGAGAGSMMQWMAEVVGESGRVVAVDLDTRFVANCAAANVEVLEGDIRDLSLEGNTFDLIHTRYVLIHLSKVQAVLSKLWSWVKPGGWLVLEEPDFAVARAIAGEETACESVNRVNQAIEKMFALRGFDYALGSKIPAILQKYDLQQLWVENDAPLAAGRSGVATVMKMSAMQLAEQYLATGQATRTDLERYCQFADTPNAWAIYYATVGAIAQKQERTA